MQPENLLLDCYNNIKICDLGWAAEDVNQKRTTFCGTYEYMAPEMLFKTDYDHRVDIWALGVLLYELLHGHAPFKGKTVVEVQESMLKGGYHINPNLSESARDLISNILQISVGKRFRIEQIFKHPWVKEMESHINNYLRLDNVELPHEVCQKISKIPAMPLYKAKRDTDQHKNTDHRKNNSMNIMEPNKEAPLHVSLTKPTKVNHHSH